jgi:hypothetical protein
LVAIAAIAAMTAKAAPAVYQLAAAYFSLVAALHTFPKEMLDSPS